MSKTCLLKKIVLIQIFIKINTCNISHPLSVANSEPGFDQLQKIRDDSLQGLLGHAGHHPVVLAVLLRRVVPVPQGCVSVFVVVDVYKRNGVAKI